MGGGGDKREKRVQGGHLAAVGVGARVGHGEQAGCVVLELEVLVRKLLAVDALTAGAVVVGEVAPLQHEPGDDAVEARPLEPEALLFGAQQPEVARGFRHHVVKKLEDDAAGGLSSDGHLEEHV